MSETALPEPAGLTPSWFHGQNAFGSLKGPVESRDCSLTKRLVVSATTLAVEFLPAHLSNRWLVTHGTEGAVIIAENQVGMSRKRLSDCRLETLRRRCA